MSKFNNPKNIIKCAQNIGCTHVQCVSNHDNEQSKCIKFEDYGMKLLESQITQTRHPLAFQMDKISKFNRPKKIRKYLSNVHKIEHVERIDNHYAKLEY